MLEISYSNGHLFLFFGKKCFTLNQFVEVGNTAFNSKCVLKTSPLLCTKQIYGWQIFRDLVEVSVKNQHIFIIFQIYIMQTSVVRNIAFEWVIKAAEYHFLLHQWKPILDYPLFYNPSGVAKVCHLLGTEGYLQLEIQSSL